MDEKFYYESLLTTVKSLCNILFSATTESNNPHVHQTFQTGLNVCLAWQNSIFKKMETNGFYKLENVDKSVITKEQNKIEPLNMPYNECCNPQDQAR